MREHKMEPSSKEKLEEEIIRKLGEETLRRILKIIDETTLVLDLVIEKLRELRKKMAEETWTGK